MKTYLEERKAALASECRAAQEQINRLTAILLKMQGAMIEIEQIVQHIEVQESKSVPESAPKESVSE